MGKPAVDNGHIREEKTHTRRSSQFSIGSSVIIELFNIEWLDFKFYFNSWKIIASAFFQSILCVVKWSAHVKVMGKKLEKCHYYNWNEQKKRIMKCTEKKNWQRKKEKETFLRGQRSTGRTVSVVVAEKITPLLCNKL